MTHPDTFVYFDEGKGFNFIKHLGDGVEANVTLVRSRDDGKLYARKETLRPLTVVEKEGELRVFKKPASQKERSTRIHTKPQKVDSPPIEAATTSKLQHIPGVVRLEGWITHTDTDQKLSSRATYFKYYNNGGLQVMIEDIQTGEHVPLPDYWICKLGISMVDTLIQVHTANISHTDAHADNWLLHYQTEGNKEDLSIVLADFGHALRQKHAADDEAWSTACKDDMQEIMENIDLIANYAIFEKPGWEVAQKMPNPCTDACKALFLDLSHAVDREVYDDKNIREWLTKAKKYFADLKATPWPGRKPTDNFPVHTDAQEAMQSLVEHEMYWSWKLARSRVTRSSSHIVEVKRPPETLTAPWGKFQPGLHHQDGLGSTSQSRRPHSSRRK